MMNKLYVPGAWADRKGLAIYNHNATPALFVSIASTPYRGVVYVGNSTYDDLFERLGPFLGNVSEEDLIRYYKNPYAVKKWKEWDGKHVVKHFENHRAYVLENSGYISIVSPTLGMSRKIANIPEVQNALNDKRDSLAFWYGLAMMGANSDHNRTVVVALLPSDQDLRKLARRDVRRVLAAEANKYCWQEVSDDEFCYWDTSPGLDRTLCVHIEPP